ncbi:Uncharacterised protein [Chlamydia trachomatis]|nr:Uncharacterised protein [Chlamydia trachomatis]
MIATPYQREYKSPVLANLRSLLTRAKMLLHMHVHQAQRFRHQAL